MTKHTAGPWAWTTDDSGPEDEYGCQTRGPVDMDTFKSKGYCNNPELYAGEVCILSGGGGEYNPLRSTPADARLIAAAPDLLDALKKLTDDEPIEDDSDDGLRCFYCRKPSKVINVGGNLGRWLNHATDCEWVVARAAILKAEGSAET